MDFFFLRDELLPPDKGLPSARNTILHDSKEEGTARFSSTADIDWLDSYMKKIEDEPIAYLGMPLSLVCSYFLGISNDILQEACPPLPLNHARHAHQIL